MVVWCFLCSNLMHPKQRLWKSAFCGSFQGCEYFIWTTNHRKVDRKGAFHLLWSDGLQTGAYDACIIIMCGATLLLVRVSHTRGCVTSIRISSCDFDRCVDIWSSWFLQTRQWFRENTSSWVSAQSILAKVCAKSRIFGRDAVNVQPSKLVWAHEDQNRKKRIK